MNSRTFLMLVTALVITLALLYSGLEQKKNAGKELLLPSLALSVNDIERIVVTGPGRQTIASLAKSDTGWTVDERGGYPADIGKIRQNVLTLAGARVVEEKTSNPELYDRLGVQDIDSEDATGVELAIYTPEETTVLIVGETGVQGENAYVRRAGEARSWLVSADLDLGRETTDWVESEFLDIAPVSLQAVTITHPDQSVMRIEKASRDDTFVVAEVPAGRELSFGGVASGVGSALSTLSFDNVLPDGEKSLDGIAPVLARYESFDGLIVRALSYSTEDGVWTKFGFDVDMALAARFTGDDATDKDSAVQARAAELNAKHGPWLYKLPSFKSDQLMKRMEDLLKPVA